MIYGYASVSALWQNKEGKGLEAQERALRASGAEEIYSDIFKGGKRDRPQFNALMDKLVEGDMIVVTRLDRVARSAVESIKLVDGLVERGMKIRILNIGIVSDNIGGRLIRNILFAFAEFERDLITERTQAGKEIARAKKGFKDGRPKKYAPEQIRHALDLLKSHTYKEVEAMVDISKSTLQRAKRHEAGGSDPKSPE